MLKVLVLEGGYNEEHEISLKTSIEIKKILKKLNINFKSLLVNPGTFEKDIRKFSKHYICFNALHGPFGEDGTIQKIVKKYGFKITHSGFRSSSNCFSKIKSKKIIQKLKIPTAKFIEIKSKNLSYELLVKFKKKFGKFVIKPNSSGSSFGIKIIKNDSQLNNLKNNLNIYKNDMKMHEILLIEKCIEGRELTVSVLQNNKATRALEVTEIITINKYFDYEAKYTKDFSKHIIPANISKTNYKKCLRYALTAHKALNCNTISRTDFIYNKKENKIFYLETNQQPGLTKLSLVPEQAKYKNISFEKIVLELILNSK